MPAPALKPFLSPTHKLRRAGQREAPLLRMEDSSGGILGSPAGRGSWHTLPAPCNFKPSVSFNMRTLVGLSTTLLTDPGSSLPDLSLPEAGWWLGWKMVKGLVERAPRMDWRVTGQVAVSNFSGPFKPGLRPLPGAEVPKLEALIWLQ